MKLTRTTGYVMALAVLSIIYLAMYSGAKNNNVIKIGYIAPFTGPAADTSKQIIDSFKLANESNPGFGNKKIEVIYEDDSCDPKKAVSAAHKLIDIDKVKIIVSGVCSGSVLAIAPVAEASKVILLTPIASSPKITTAGDYVFRTSGNAVQTANSISKEVFDKLLKKKAGIIFEKTDYALGWKDSFEASFKSLGGTIVSEEGFNTKDSDLRSQLTKISATKPDVIIAIPNSASSVNTILNQMHELGIKIPVVGDEYFAFKQSTSNQYAEGQYATIYKYDPENGKLQLLRKLFLDKYGINPDVEIYSAMTFDAYEILKHGIEECGGDNTLCLKKYIYSLKNYAGASGNISIDENGDAVRDSELKQIKGMKLISI